MSVTAQLTVVPIRRGETRLRAGSATDQVIRTVEHGISYDKHVLDKHHP